jgi:uncharacterized protein (TIGR03118 family)
MTQRLLPALLGTAALLSISLAAASAHAIEFKSINLVSDGFVPAAHTDPGLINPWGVSYAPGSPFWVSDNGTSQTTLYNGHGSSIAALPKVDIQPPGSAPTGQVFNAGLGNNAFQIDGKTPVFLFTGEDGHISGWIPSGGPTAPVGFTTSDGAVFKGLALATSGANTMLYATDFHNNSVDMFTNTLGSFTTFTDTTVNSGYAPFNAQVLNGLLYVTFAQQDGAAHDDVGGPGNGYVDVFNLDGTLNHRIASFGDPNLNSPWGLAIAPSSWGEFAGKLLVGNFGDGTISVFDQNTNVFLGKLDGTDGKPLQFGDLWALIPGNDGRAGSSQDIYFTAGIVDEAHGLFGRLSVAPEPGVWTMMILGFGLTGAALRSRRVRTARTV